MCIDPSAVFLHTFTSLPLRFVLAWAVGTLGAFTPIFIRHGFEAVEIIQWQFLFFPLYLFFSAMMSGWWGFVAIPLLVGLCWRLLVFLRYEGSRMELLWIFILPFLIGIRTSGDAWPFAALLAAIGIVFIIRQQRRSGVYSL